MKVLDLFCGAGGAAKGLQRAGFYIVGVDINPQPNYCGDKFIQADAVSVDLDDFDAYWASPPCQAYTWASSIPRKNGKVYPDLISQTRERLLSVGKPFVIENVIGAPIRRDLKLCGTMFGLNVIRHRYFEIERFSVPQPLHPTHKSPVIVQTRNGTVVKRSQYCSVAGHGGSGCSYKFEDWQKAMGIDWMTKGELTQAVPPPYSEYIGKCLMSYLMGVIKK